LDIKNYNELESMFTSNEISKYETTRRFYGLRDDGLLIHKQLLTRHGIRGQFEQIIVPQEMLNSVLKYYHENVLCSHDGIYRTFIRIQEKFYYGGLTREVKRHVKACLKCNMNKYSEPKKQGLMKTFPASRPFQIVGIDIVGPFRVSEKETNLF